ncbi:hypothetical protein H109_03012 [Trichophyton interdigitale MR816]|uniref:Uncharacterized protein n=1 Tax=Trichophyton interdigitale (strain MR816) TaxID=1215338 RepID=A0A059JBV8_TRIIM|nr:hypothetical protein H101_01323 [Trichophyton interdigitale H6]KDB25148.1 hypothetical protein H109_03012 [Trichophyton interdigitale MR816]
MLTQQAWDVAMRRRFNFKFTSSKHPFVSPHPAPVVDESRYYNFDDTLAPIRPGSPLADRPVIDPTTLVHLRHACILLYHRVKNQGQPVRRAAAPQPDPVYFQHEHERHKLAAHPPPDRRPIGSVDEGVASGSSIPPESASSGRPRPLVRTDLPSPSLPPASGPVAPNSASVVTDQPSSPKMGIRRTASAPMHTETGIIVEDPSYPYTSRNCQVPSVSHGTGLPTSPMGPAAPVSSLQTRPEHAPHSFAGCTAGRQGFQDSDTETLAPTETDIRQHAESTPGPISQSMGLVPVATQASDERSSSSSSNSSADDTTNTAVTTVTTTSTSSDITAETSASTPPPATSASAATTASQLSRVQTFVKKLSKFGFNKKKASSSNQRNIGLGMAVEAT